MRTASANRPRAERWSITGAVTGAGVGLALGCDTIVVSTEARFVLSFGKVGLIPDFGLPHTLPLRVGQGRARQMMLYGEPVDAAAALEMGLVDQMVPPGTALAAASSASSSAIRASRTASAAATSAASNFCGMCCGQLVSHAAILNTITCSGRAL